MNALSRPCIILVCLSAALVCASPSETTLATASSRPTTVAPVATTTAATHSSKPTAATSAAATTTPTAPATSKEAQQVKTTSVPPSVAAGSTNPIASMLLGSRSSTTSPSPTAEAVHISPKSETAVGARSAAPEAVHTSPKFKTAVAAATFTTTPEPPLGAEAANHHHTAPARTTTPRLHSEVKTTSSWKLSAKIVDSVLVIGSLAGAAAVAGGVAAGVEIEKGKKGESKGGETKAPSDSFPPVHHLRSSGGGGVHATTAPAASTTTFVITADAPKTATIEMFPGGKEGERIADPHAGANTGGGHNGNPPLSLPGPAWMLVIGLAIVGCCLLAAGALLLCFQRTKKSSRIWARGSMEDELDEAEVQAASQRSREAREEFAGQSERLNEPEQPLLPPLPPLLPRPVHTMRPAGGGRGGPVMMAPQMSPATSFAQPRYAPVQTTGQLPGYAVRGVPQMR